MKVRALFKQSVEVVAFIDGIGLRITSGGSEKDVLFSPSAALKLGRGLVAAAEHMIPVVDPVAAPSPSPLEHDAT